MPGEMKTYSASWKESWQNLRFRKLIITGVVLLIALLISFPFFFQLIEKRKCFQLNDPLLSMITAHDLSVVTFILIWSGSLLMLIRCIKDASVFVLFLWGFILLYLFRIVTISCVPLDAPLHLIPLKDPLSNTFYGSGFITKDLFFSGHVASQFLIFLCIKGKKYKIFCLSVTIAVAILVLIQHVHYTIDVLAAPLFTYLVYLLSKRMVSNV